MPKDDPAQWIAIDTLQLRVDRIRLDQAIVLAALSGWLKISGNPPKLVAITAEGIALLGQSGA